MELTYTDPIVVVLAWLLVAVLRKYWPGEPSPERKRVIDRLAPTLAILLAVFVQTAADALGVAGADGLSLESVSKAVGAGAMAVYGHSQFRELQKWKAEPPVAPAEPPAEPSVEEGPPTDPYTEPDEPSD